MLSLYIPLGCYLPRRRGAITAPPHCRGLGPQPIIVSMYQLRSNVHPYLSDALAYIGLNERDEAHH
jgi:hypothetical protein